MTHPIMTNCNIGTIEEVVNEFIRRVRAEFRVDAAYWFGSTAHGTGDECSDIDIAIVSPDFSGVRFDDVQKLIPIAVKLDSRIEVHPFSTAEFGSGPMMAIEIKRTGKRVA